MCKFNVIESQEHFEHVANTLNPKYLYFYGNSVSAICKSSRQHCSLKNNTKLGSESAVYHILQMTRWA